MKRILVLALVASLALGIASFAQDTSALADSASPDNARGLALLASNERAAQKWADAKQHAEQGLQALARMSKADDVSEEDFAKQKTQLSALLNSVAGFSALQLKDYAAAQKYLRPAVEAYPTNVENVYPLALAYLTATPPDDVNGLFFIARAANLVSDPRGRDSIIKFGRGRYQKYHGSDQGWDDLLATTKTTLLPPPGSPSSGQESSPVELREGQTPQEVEKVLGKPSDTITLKGNLVYIYPTVKVIFENGKLVDVQYQK